MSLLATCLTLPALIAANPGATITLQRGSVCPTLVIAAKPAKRVTVNAGGTLVNGIHFKGAANIRWRSGIIQAAQGPFAIGKGGYGVFFDGATGITLDGALITGSRKGAVVGGSQIAIADNRFFQNGEDGIIASGVTGFRVLRNRFALTIGKPSECEVAGVVAYSIAKRDCTGIFRDSTHADAIQMRNGVTDALIEGNSVEGGTQGITQMDTTGDAPLVRVVIRGNTVRTDRQHKITLDQCIDCLIEGNTVGRMPGSTRKPVIIPGTAKLGPNVVEP